MRIICNITTQIALDGNVDVVTGFGCMNEPGPYIKVPLLMDFYSAVRIDVLHFLRT